MQQPGRSLPVLSTAAMRAADRATIESLGVPGFALMETAARGALAELEERLGPAEGLSVLVLAGKGNNGGDGLALARLLAIRGARVLALTTARPGDASEDAARNLAMLERLEDDELCWLDVEQVGAGASAAELAARVAAWRAGAGDRTLLAVDALLGVGSSGPLRAPCGALAALCEDFDEVLALDLPSGVDADTGEAQEGSVAASFTVAMGALKPGLFLGEGAALAGEVSVVDIGVPPSILREAAGEAGSGWLLGDGSVEGLVDERPRGSHKFSVGQLAVLAGSDAYSGAAVLACRAAARAGAGYVVLFSSPAACAAADNLAPELATVPLQGDLESSMATIQARAERAKAFVVGPGVEDAPKSGRRVRAVLGALDVPAVVDAGGLAALVEVVRDGELAALSRGRFVLTPHPGELARLVEAMDDPPRGTPLERGRALAARWDAVLVLKGAPTLICDPGGAVFVAADAPVSLATAGSGDVLAGMIGGLLAQGLEPLDAALVGVHLGLAAAEAACRGRSERSMIATDLIEALPAVLASFGTPHEAEPGL